MKLLIIAFDCSNPWLQLKVDLIFLPQQWSLQISAQKFKQYEQQYKNSYQSSEINIRYGGEKSLHKQKKINKIFVKLLNGIFSLFFEIFSDFANFANFNPKKRFRFK